MDYQKIVDDVMSTFSHDEEKEIEKFKSTAAQLMSMGVKFEKLRDILGLIEKHDKIIDKDGKIINEKFFEEVDIMIKEPDNIDFFEFPNKEIEDNVRNKKYSYSKRAELFNKKEFFHTFLYEIMANINDEDSVEEYCGLILTLIQSRFKELSCKFSVTENKRLVSADISLPSDKYEYILLCIENPFKEWGFKINKRSIGTDVCYAHEYEISY